MHNNLVLGLSYAQLFIFLLAVKEAMTMEDLQELQYEEYDPVTSDQISELSEFELLTGSRGKVARRLAMVCLVGTSLALMKVLLTTNYSIQHALYFFVGIIIFLNYCFRNIELYSKWLVFVIVWWLGALLISTYVFSPFVLGVYPIKRCLFLLSTVACGMAVGSSQDSVRKFTKLMTFTAILSCFVGAIQAATGKMFWFTALERGMEGREWAEQAGRAYGFFANPNSMANWLLVPMAVTMARIAYPPSRGAGKLPWILWPILLGGVMLSVSRSALLGTVVIVIMVMGKRVLNLKMLTSVSASLVVIIVGARWIIPEFFTGVVERFHQFGLDPARRELFRLAWESLGQKSVIGVGFLGFRAYSEGRASHIGILEPLIELGIVGFIPVMLGLCGGILCFWRCAKLSKGTDMAWFWRGWAAGVTGMVLSSMLHGNGWHSLDVWAFMGIGSVGLVYLKNKLYYEYETQEYAMMLPAGEIAYIE